MNTKKRLFAILMALLVTLAFVSPVMAKAKESIDVWQIHSPVKEIMAAFDWAAKDFEAKTGIHVNMVRIPTEDLHTKLMVSVSARQYPDILIWNIKPGIELSNLGIVRQVNDIVKKVGEDRFSKGALTLFQSPLGVQWEIPLFARLGGIHYWKDWLAEAGFDPEPRKDAKGNYAVEALDDWTSFVAVAQKLTRDINGDGKIDRWGFGQQYNRKGFGDSAGYAMSMILSYGGHVLDPKTGEIVFKSPETIKAVQFMKDIYWKYKIVPEGVTAWGGYDNNMYFEKRVVGAIMNSATVLPKLQKEQPNLVSKLGGVPWPAAPGGGRKWLSSADSITIFKTRNEKLAEEFALFLLDKDTQVEMFKRMGVSYYGPIRTDVMDDPFFDSISKLDRMFIENNKYLASPGYPGVDTPGVLAAYNSFVFDDILSRITVDNWSAERAVDEAVSRIKELIEENK